jgi:hypothetical protein
MKSLSWIITGCALLVLMAAYPSAQEKSAVPGNAAEDQQESAETPGAVESTEAPDPIAAPAALHGSASETTASPERVNDEAAERSPGKRSADRPDVAGDTIGLPPTGATTARGNWLQSLQMAADPDAEVRRVQNEFRRLDQNASGLARQFLKAREAAAAKGLSSLEDPACVKLKEQLQSTVEAAFDARQKIQWYELEQLRQRLARIEAQVATREQSQIEVIRQRVEELLHPERKWESAAESDRTPAGRNQISPDHETKEAADDFNGADGHVAKNQRGAELPVPAKTDRTSAVGSFRGRGENPRKDLLEAEWAVSAARAAVAAAEKSCEFSRTDSKRTLELFRKGAATQNAAIAAEKQVAADEARLEKARLNFQHAERQAKVARENLDTQKKLLSLDLADAKLRIEHLAEEEIRARRLLESKAIAKAAYDEKKLALDQARLQLSRITELMELYAKPIPGEERPATDEVNEESEDPLTKKAADEPRSKRE